MIKLTHSKSATADAMTREGHILTLNGTDYDLSDLSSLPQKIEATEENPVPDSGPVYTDGTDTHVYFKADQYQFDDLSHGNLLRVHDLNNNGQLETEEFLQLVDYLNLPEAEKREYRKSVMDAFITPLISKEFRKYITDYTIPADKDTKAKIISGLTEEKQAIFKKEYSDAKRAWIAKGKD